MEKNEHALQEAMRIAQSPAGKQLWNLLQRNNQDALNKAMQLAAKGNIPEAQSILKSLLEDSETQNILRQIGGTHE